MKNILKVVIVGLLVVFMYMISNRSTANISNGYDNDNLDSILAYEDAYATVLLDLDFYEPVFMITDEKIIQFCNDSINEVYIIINLLEKKNNQYRVIAWNSKESRRIGEGWIPTSTPITIFTRAYRPDIEPLKIFEKPSFSSRFECDTVYRNDDHRVVDFSGKWLKIEIREEGDVIYTGWIEPNMQCPNPYTTCC